MKGNSLLGIFLNILIGFLISDVVHYLDGNLELLI